MRHYLILLFAVIFTLVTSLLPHLAVAEPENYKFEGVVSDIGDDPAALSAIINGDLYRAGDMLDEYYVEKVEPSAVRLRHKKSGKAENLVVASASDTTAEPKPQKTNWFEKSFGGFMSHISQNVTQVKYAAVIRDLRKVHREAWIYVINSGRQTISVPALVAEGRLPPAFQDGVHHGYRFRIQTLKNGVRVNADPADKKSGYTHFLMDEHSYLYREEGRPATQRSEQFNTGYTVSVT